MLAGIAAGKSKSVSFVPTKLDGFQVDWSARETARATRTTPLDFGGVSAPQTNGCQDWAFGPGLFHPTMRTRNHGKGYPDAKRRASCPAYPKGSVRQAETLNQRG